MPSTILYTFRRCPYAMRARLALTLSQEKIQIREIVLRNKPATMLHYSPKGTVPV
ncbi:glutathione S-transferase N-terminal domain-containing protein, partial [Oleiphilus sp. HI0123]